MKNFNWEDFKKGKVAVLCKASTYKDFISRCIEHNVIWCTCEPLDISDFDLQTYGDETCYFCDSVGLTYASKEYCCKHHNNKKIIEWELDDMTNELPTTNKEISMPQVKVNIKTDNEDNIKESNNTNNSDSITYDYNKEYSIQEVLKMPKGTIVKCYPYDESEPEYIVSEGVANNKYIYEVDSDLCHGDGLIISSWLLDKAKFKLVPQDKEVSFMEAIQSYGKTIYSVYYDGDENMIKNEYYIDEYNSIKDSKGFAITPFEILNGKWFIKAE